MRRFLTKIQLKKIFITGLIIYELIFSNGLIFAQDATSGALFNITPTVSESPTPSPTTKVTDIITATPTPPANQTPTPTQITPTPTASSPLLLPTDLPQISSRSPTLFPSIFSTISPTIFFDETPTAAVSATNRRPLKINLLTKADLQARDILAVELADAENNLISYRLLKNGKSVDFPIRKRKIGKSIVLIIEPPQHFTPGRYQLEVKDISGQVIRQDFTWGVLAINTNKSIYQPYEKAKIAFAVLDEHGKMVCDAKLTLQITSNGLKINDLLSTANGRIKVNPECKYHSQTERPDYEAVYDVKGVGTYTLELTAETNNGVFKIVDNFEVRSQVDYDIERETATRIYPPALYPVRLKIKANKDFDGTIEEIVPHSFEVFPIEKDRVKNYDQVKLASESGQLNPISNHTQIKLQLPFEGDHPVSIGFGDRYSDPGLVNKILNLFNLKGHNGVDFEMEEGTKILAADDGTVVKNSSDLYGITTVIRHDWGETYYGHLQKIIVKEGETVKKGEVIALSGSTGISTGPHLHFAIKPNNTDENNGYKGMVDPLPYLPLSGDIAVQVKPEIRWQKIISWNLSLKKGEEVELGYQFKAPSISPEFYLLGPLRLVDKNERQTVFEEIRRWQLAIDANVKIRQEINIIDRIVTASGDDNAYVQLDTTKYSGTVSYYFEVVAKVDSGTMTVALERAGTSTQDATVSVTATNYTRYRSNAFTPPSSTQTEYNINLSGGTNGMVKAARILVMQEGGSSITSTQTQIEIGNYETGKTNTSASPLDSPKYWYYDSSKWDGNLTFYAEVTYKKDADVSAGSNTYTTSGSGSWTAPTNVTNVTVECWGGGGAGGGNNGNSNGGGGGGGGAYAKKNSYTVVPGNQYAYYVGNYGTGVANGNGNPGEDTYFVNSSTVMAKGGKGGYSNANGRSGGAGGLASESVGDVKYDGGWGEYGRLSSTGRGGYGGSSGGTAADGLADGSSPSWTTVTAPSPPTGAGIGGNGGTGNGLAPASGNGGGGGGSGEGTNVYGGRGATGKIIISWAAKTSTVTVKLQEDDGSFNNWSDVVTIVNAGTSTSPSRVRSSSFTPTSGRNYRLVSYSNVDLTYDIINAKIIVDQASGSAITKTETQYLIANTKLSSGTSLQDFDTYFDPNEWQSVTNTYIHEANSVSGGTSDVKLQYDPNGTPTDITGSTITDIIQREQSSAMTMPGSAQTIDVVATTNNNDIYSSRIIVQVSVEVPTISISGTTNVTSGTVAVAVGSSLQAQTGSISSGSWQITGVTPPAENDVVTVFIDGAATADKSTAVTKYDGSGDITGMVLNKHTLTIGSDDTSPSLTLTNLDAYDYSQDAQGDVIHNVSSNSLVVDGGGQFSDEKIDILSGATLTIAGGSSEQMTSHDVTINGTLTCSANASISLSGSWDNNGSFNAGSSTVTFTATSGAYTIDAVGSGSSSFYNLTLGSGSGSATWNLASALDVDNNLTIVYGTLAQNGANTINVGGNLSRDRRG